ncbi:MAG: FMN-binding protein [Treponema sp.]|nr:FMN-binding protein [Treponema sp.]
MKKIIILALLAILGTACSTEWKGLRSSLPDLNDKPDGVYRGVYHVSGTPVKVTLDVTLQNGQLTVIRIIEHRSSPIGKKAEKIIDTIIAEQSLAVDSISGATGSSIGIKKAVEIALE